MLTSCLIWLGHWWKTTTSSRRDPPLECKSLQCVCSQGAEQRCNTIHQNPLVLFVYCFCIRKIGFVQTVKRADNSIKWDFLTILFIYVDEERQQKDDTCTFMAYCVLLYIVFEAGGCAMILFIVVCLTVMPRCYIWLRFIIQQNETHQMWVLNEQTDCPCFYSGDERGSDAVNPVCILVFIKTTTLI